MLATTFTTYLVALMAAHQVADHWIQTHHQAMCKGERGRAGALACLRHVLTYTAVTAGAGLAAWQLLDLSIAPAGFVVGQVISAVTHYWADRRYTLAWLVGKLGKTGYYNAPGGAYQLDQSWHALWLTVAAVIATALR